MPRSLVKHDKHILIRRHCRFHRPDKPLRRKFHRRDLIDHNQIGANRTQNRAYPDPVQVMQIDMILPDPGSISPDVGKHALYAGLQVEQFESDPSAPAIPFCDVRADHASSASAQAIDNSPADRRLPNPGLTCYRYTRPHHLDSGYQIHKRCLRVGRTHDPGCEQHTLGAKF